MMREQFTALVDMIESEDRPLIVAGDFNLTGDSLLHAALLKTGLRDAHESAGRGRGSTWPMLGPLSFVPGVRIDHVYVGNGVTALQCTTLPANGSDHRPVLAHLRLGEDR